MKETIEEKFNHFSDKEKKIILTALVCFYGKCNLKHLPKEVEEKYGICWSDFYNLRCEIFDLEDEHVTIKGSLIL